MTRTLFVTGASSGIGKATAELFLAKGWNVVATMRDPSKAVGFAPSDRVLATRLDVLDQASIDEAVAAAIERFGAIDVLLNNAGYGAYGPLEAFDMEGIRRQFETNVIGLLAVTKAVLPHMRARKAGAIVNISSIGGKMTFPLGTLYHGTKFAVEGLSEAMHYELADIGVRMKIVEPGMVKTDFGGRSFDLRNDAALAEYQPLVGKLGAIFGSFTSKVSPPELVAEVIHAAATDNTDQLRYTAGEDARQLMAARQAQDDTAFIGIMRGLIRTAGRAANRSTKD